MTTTIPLTIPFTLGADPLPTFGPGVVHVLLDDGTGTFPYDVTSYVHLPSGVEITRGRADEHGDIDAGTLALRFDNVDGRFTVGSGTYGVHINQRIRVYVVAGTYTSLRFTGYVQEWPTAWPTPTASYAVAQVTATDRLPRFERRVLRSMDLEEFLVDDPVLFYPLLTNTDGQDPGADVAGKSPGSAGSGKGRKSLRKKSRGKPKRNGKQYATDDDPLVAPDVLSGLTDMTLEAAIQVDSATLDLQAFIVTARSATDHGRFVRLGFDPITYDDRAYAQVAGTSGAPGTFIQVHGGPSLGDGQLHHVAATVDGSVLNLYVDGVLAGTTTDSSIGSLTDLTDVEIGETVFGPIAGPGGSFADPEDGTVALSHVAVFDTPLPAARIADHAEGVLTLFDGEYPGERLIRLATYGGVDRSEMTGNIDASSTILPVQPTDGVTVRDAMSLAAQAEGGLTYIGRSGGVVLQNRGYRAKTSEQTAVLALASSDVEADLLWTADTQYLVNYVSATREGGVEQVVGDETSIATHGRYEDSISGLLVNSDLEALGRAQWLTAVYAQPSPRISSLPLDLMTLSATIRTAALNLELGDRVTVSSLPGQSPAATADLLMEGYAEHISDTEWSLVLNTSPAAIWQTWVLEDATYGQLGTTTKLLF